MILSRILLAAGMLVGAFALVQSQGLAGDKKKDGKKSEVAKETIVNGALIDSDDKDRVRSSCYCKTYTFKMTEGKTYQIDMMSKELDSYLRLENPEGNQVAADDDGGDNRDARIRFSAPKTGDYKIIATTFGLSTGKFTLIVKEVKSDVDSGKAIELKVEKGLASHTTNLLPTDPRYRNKAHKLFLFMMEEGKTYQIDMKSKALDSYLFLEGPAGDLLAQDDDGGGFLDARIVHKAAKSGKYRIIATCFGGGTGEFMLTVQATDEKKE